MRLRDWNRVVLGCLTVFLCTLGGCSQRDMVDIAFETIQEEYGVFRGREKLSSSKDWFKAYRVADDDIVKILRCDLAEFGYAGWECYRGRRSCGIDPSIKVDGIRNRVMWNRTSDSDDFDMEAIFVDMDAKCLILFYGRTYGM